MLGVLQLILQRLGQGEYDLKKFDQQLPVLVWRKSFQRQSLKCNAMVKSKL
jgi:hypothetical protein